MEKMRAQMRLFTMSPPLTTQIWSWSVETAGKQRGVETLDAGDKPQGN